MGVYNTYCTYVCMYVYHITLMYVYVMHICIQQQSYICMYVCVYVGAVHTYLCKLCHDVLQHVGGCLVEQWLQSGHVHTLGQDILQSTL